MNCRKCSLIIHHSHRRVLWVAWVAGEGEGLSASCLMNAARACTVTPPALQLARISTRSRRRSDLDVILISMEVRPARGKRARVSRVGAVVVGWGGGVSGVGAGVRWNVVCP